MGCGASHNDVAIAPACVELEPAERVAINDIDSKNRDAITSKESSAEAPCKKEEKTGPALTLLKRAASFITRPDEEEEEPASEPAFGQTGEEGAEPLDRGDHEGIGRRLHEAAEKGDFDTLVRMLATKQGQENVDQKLFTGKFNSKSVTPLMSAIIAGQEESARFLASKTSDINHHVEDSTPLAVSVIYHKHAITKFLVEDYNADVDFSVGSGSTPLMASVVSGNEEAVAYLLSRGAMVDKIADNMTALGVAAMMGFMSIARLLMEKGADESKALSQDDEGWADAEDEITKSFFNDLRRLAELRKTLKSERKALEIEVASFSDVKRETLPTTTKGIKIRGLLKVAEELKLLVSEGRFAREITHEDGTICPPVTKYEDLTTTHVVYGWVKEATGDKRLADYSKELTDDLGIPTYFISHAWKGGWAKLVEEIISYCKTKSLSDETCVWIDVIAVNQNATGANSTEFSRAQNRSDVAAFQNVLKTCLDGTIVVADFARCHTSTRAWCLYEWDWTISLHGREALTVLGLSPKEAEDGMDTIDIEKATCFARSDYEMILSQVVEKHGSADAFNKKLQAKWLEVAIKLMGTGPAKVEPYDSD